uniref:P7 n=1 Tax=peony leafroll-associated virus TaxID=2974943 RepID=A0A977XRJ8_9CLOS|nr:P6 [peony leafroll-associated virus]UXV25352.1 p7 [peony leafroll-associated virus]
MEDKDFYGELKFLGLLVIIVLVLTISYLLLRVLFKRIRLYVPPQAPIRSAEGGSQWNVV